MYEEASVEDLVILLGESVIMYKKAPIIVKGITPNKELSVSYLSQKDTEIVPLDSPDLDFKPVPLGMCNYNGHTFFLVRKPRRQWSQGLTKNNIEISSISQDEEGRNGNWKNLLTLHNKSIHSCIMGEYPSIEGCITALDKPTVFGMAFSREFALDKNLSLYHRKAKVGMIDNDNGKIIFNNDKKFLKELLNA